MKKLTKICAREKAKEAEAADRAVSRTHLILYPDCMWTILLNVAFLYISAFHIGNSYLEQFIEV